MTPVTLRRRYITAVPHGAKRNRFIQCRLVTLQTPVEFVRFLSVGLKSVLKKRTCFTLLSPVTYMYGINARGCFAINKDGKS